MVKKLQRNSENHKQLFLEWYFVPRKMPNRHVKTIPQATMVITCTVVSDFVACSHVPIIAVVHRNVLGGQSFLSLTVIHHLI